MKHILAAFARNRVFANILLVMILLSGGIAAVSMICETFPEVSLDIISVTVLYPGADPEEVEEGICQKLEEAVKGLEGVKAYTTTASENTGSMSVEVKEGYDLYRVLDRVKSQVDAISTFPEDAEKPIITERVLRKEVLSLSLTGDMSERRLKEWAEQIKDEVLNIPEISQAEIFGTREYEISIEVSEDRLRQYGITLGQVADAVRQSNLNLAGGTIRSRGEEIRLRTLGRKYTGKELSTIVVLARPEGEIITLDRLAVINDGFTEDPIRARVDGIPAVILTIYKTQEEDALAIVDAVSAFLEKKQQILPKGLNVKIFYSDTDILRARINLLVKNGCIGMALVFLLLWIFLGPRLSLWAGMGIPISIAGAMAILWALGVTINMISLFGLVMVLGIVVDDAIVVGESIYVHRKRGASPITAAVGGALEVAMPVVCAVLTTIVAFVPLAFVKGVLGKIVVNIPTVVISCLAISLLECLLLLPAHLSHLPNPNTERKSKKIFVRRLQAFQRLTENGMEWFVIHIYTPFLSKALKFRYISLCTALSVLMLTLGLIKSGIIKLEDLPNLDGNVVAATVEFPHGTPLEMTEQATKQVEAALVRLAEGTDTVSGKPLLKHRLVNVGQDVSEFMNKGPHLGAVKAVLIDSDERGIHSDDILVAWEKEIGAIAGIKSLRLEGMGGGPPGDPIEIWIQGKDMELILNAADEVMARLQRFKGIYQVRSDFSFGKNEIRFDLKPEAHTLGLTVEDLARQVYAGYYGEEAVRLQRGRDDVRVKVRYTTDERRNVSELNQVRIRTATGREVPLLSVADVWFSPGYATITRTNGMRRVAVSAAVDTNKGNANEIISNLSRTFFPGLNARYPGIEITLQGEQKHFRESIGSLFVGFPLAILAIFLIICSMFRSYLQPFVILFTVPFGIIGGVIGHLLLGYDMVMMSLFGMVALSGVVVNDAIVLIERVNENIAMGMPFFEAIKMAGARRFRAIFLTTLSTVGGLSPLILETDIQAQLLIPMAISIAAGLIFATVLTLVLIPSLLVILNDLRILTHRARYGRWPERERVEPARGRYDHLNDKKYVTV